MKKYMYTIACIMILAATLSSCSNKAFPTGTYTTTGQGSVEYRDDGTMTLWYGDDVVTTGTYSVEKNEIHFLHDTYCDEHYGGDATYKWQYEDGVLTFELIGEDLCDGRRNTTSQSYFGPK